MCDTQVLISEDAVWFAKNSDREPSEPQPVVRLAPVAEDSQRTVRVTHIEIPQVARRHAVILSKPAWCWGAEMGVNDAGVAIGNEAIFSRRASLKPALLGMDLVRLGLERAASASAAVTVITDLLAAHGQGGAAGFSDQRFCYDNSFLVADSREAWLLETAGQSWAAKRVERAEAISNRLTLGADYQRASPDLQTQPAFARRFDTRLMPYFAGATQRRRLALTGLSPAAPASFAHFATQLRRHAHGHDNPLRGSNNDVCMHAAGYIRRHQTTGSMIVRLQPAALSAWFTGTSAPCLSIFRPAGFSGDWGVLTPEPAQVAALLWRRHEWLHRRALADATLRQRLRVTRDQVERQVFALLEPTAPAPEALIKADRLVAAWHKVLWEAAAKMPSHPLPRHWQRIAQRDGIDPVRAAVDEYNS